MRLKQSSEEYQKNLDTAIKRLSPSVLSETPEGAESNGYLMGNWLKKNCVENDAIDASVGNIISAIVALDRAGLIDWKIAPVKKPAKPQPAFLQTHEGKAPNHAREAQVSEIDVKMAQERKRREQLADVEHSKIMVEAARLVANHSSLSHSRTKREKAVLQEEFDRLVKARAHPKDLLAALQAKQDTFANGDVTRPSFGGK